MTVSRQRHLGGLARLLVLAMLAVAGFVAGPTATSSAAETHTITMDNGRLTMGYVFLNNKILPADVPGPLNPHLANSSTSGTIDVQIDGTTATVAEADFKMPIVWIPDPTANQAPIPMDFGPSGPLTGTWDAGTGRLNLTGTLQVDVIWGFNDDGAQICRFTAPNVTWTTDPNAISPGVPFSSPQGLEGTGAISAFWEDLPNGVSINGGSCGKPNAVVHDPGAVWLSSGIAQVPPAPTCQQQGKEGLWPDCVDPEPWPEPEPEPTVNISKVQVGSLTVKQGKKAMLPVTVTNTGDLAASGLKVSLTSSKAGVKIAKQAMVTVPAGGKTTTKVTVTVSRKVTGKATITAKVAGKTGKGIVTVKKVRRR